MLHRRHREKQASLGPVYRALLEIYLVSIDRAFVGRRHTYSNQQALLDRPGCWKGILAEASRERSNLSVTFRRQAIRKDLPGERNIGKVSDTQFGHLLVHGPSSGGMDRSIVKLLRGLIPVDGLIPLGKFL